MPKKNMVEEAHGKYKSRRGQKDDKSFFENFGAHIANKLGLDGGDGKGRSLTDIRKQLP